MSNRGCVLFVIVLTSLPSLINAQGINDELKRSLRESLVIPEKIAQPLLQQQNTELHELKQDPGEVLKVSPFTRLPTKYDRLMPPYQPEKLEVKMHIIPTNAPPINVRPAGSTKFMHESGKMWVQPTGGEVVNPSGMDFDPVRAIRNYRLEKRRKKLKQILDAY